jgi:putative spermidine/putrescine transport system ATP-binding protein
VGLATHAGHYPHQLSGGQQQRVALARALAIAPQVLLLDEPLSALDAKVRSQLRDEIRRVQREVGTTTLFVTHDQEEALAMADRVGVMSAGQLQQIAPPAELYERPRTAFVAEFVGLTNRLPGTIVEPGQVRVLDATMPALPGSVESGAATVLVRPESVLVTPTPTAPGMSPRRRSSARCVGSRSRSIRGPPPARRSSPRSPAPTWPGWRREPACASACALRRSSRWRLNCRCRGVAQLPLPRRWLNCRCRGGAA